MRFLVFLGVVLTILAGVHLYLWWRLVAGPFPRGRGRRVATLILVGLALLTPLAIISRWFLPDLQGVFVLPGYLWLALMFYLLVTLLLFEPVRAGAWLLHRWRGRTPATTGAAADATTRLAVGNPTGPAAGNPDLEPPPSSDDSVPDPGRRLLLSRTMALASCAAATSLVGYGVVRANSSVPVKHVPITLPRLDPRLDGFRIALLADVHLSELIRRPFLADVIRTVNRLNAGAVAIVGDLVDGSVARLAKKAAALQDLQSRHGVYFVTGNHEYYSGAEEWVDFLPSLGIRVLRNERLAIAEGGAAFDLAGIDDRAALDAGVPGHGPDLSAALQGRRSDRPVVLLAHQPVAWPDAVERGVDLQLSGHTHGGQLVPFNAVVRLQQPVVAGLAHRGASQLYVTRGVGYWGPPVRVGAPPEITAIELRVPR